MKKRFEYSTWIGVVLALVLIGITPLVYGEIYNSSRPTIKVTYYENPVTIETFTLTHQSLPGFHFTLYPPVLSDPALEFNFTTSYLLRGNYTFRICAHDADYNRICTPKNFTINTSNDIWLADPAPLGIGKTPVYNITFASRFNMTCRYNTNTSFQNASQLYKSALNLNQTGSLDHLIRDFNASGLSTPKLELLVCRLSDAPTTNESEEYYRVIYFYAGYDTTPPSIVVGAHPNPIIDYARKYTTVTLVANDSVQCRIINTESPPSLLAMDQRFEGTNPAEYIQYKKINTFLLNLTERINDKTYRNINYTIECNNTAQWQNSTTLAIEYNISENIGITQLTNFSPKKDNFLYRIQTTLKAEWCTLSVNNQDAESMTEIPGWDNNYTRSVSGLNEGNNSMRVTCSATGADNQRTETFNLIVDNENPFLNITSITPSCSLNKFLIQYIAYDNTSGIASLNYTITKGTNLILKNSTAVNNTYNWENLYINVTDKSIIANGQYVITVFAIDQSGQISPSLSKSIIASTPTASGCSVCDNKILETAEDCEYDTSGNVYFRNNCTDLVNSASPTYEKYFGGELRCDATCKADKTNCEKSNNAGYCGDKIINNFYIEQCDGNPTDSGFNPLKSWGRIPITINDGCRVLGFTGGTLSCNAPWTPHQCEFNTSGCTSPNSDALCKDYLLESGEQCEVWNPFKNYAPNHITNCTDFDGFDGGNLKCTDTCQFDLTNCTRPEVCGDGIVIRGGREDCEPHGTIKGCYNTYPKLYASGNLSCNPKGSLDVNGSLNECRWNVSACIDLPICSNGAVENGEKCDGTNLSGVTCKGRMYGAGIAYVDGILGCNADCKNFDERNCQKAGQNGYCGDNKVNNYYTEQCDGSDWGTITTCADLGFEGGTLKCGLPFSADQCKFNTSDCDPKQNSELGCTGTGASYITAGEQCQDGILFNNQNFYAKPLLCTDFDTFIGGNLSCKSCRIDISGCFAGCGDGHFDAITELCEKGDTPLCTAINNTLYTSGTASCADGCNLWDTTNCVKKNPELVIDAPQRTCGLTNFTFRATMTETANPIQNIIYILNTTNFNKQYVQPIALLSSPSTFIITTAETLSEGKNYTIAAYVNDSEGKKSFVQIKNITAVNTNHALCEKIPPIITLTLTNTSSYAISAVVNCTDAQTGCAETYLYKFIDKTAQCNLTPNTAGVIVGAMTKKYVDQPFIINDTTTSKRSESVLCIAAFDHAGNVAYTQGAIKIIIPVCKNSIIEGNEQCDWNGTLFIIKNTAACAQFEYDPNSIHGLQKSGTGKYYVNGNLGCTDQCMLRYDNCNYGAGYCGDNTTNTYYYETCDGNDWGRISKGSGNGCTDLGFSGGGTLKCGAPFNTNQCQFDTSECIGSWTSSGKIGNGVLDPGEQCDPGKVSTTYPYNASCQWFDSFVTGTVRCTSGAMLDLSGCSSTIIPGARCGNGVKDSDEECDFDRVLNKYSYKYECEDYYYTDANGVRRGFGGGNLQCNADCTVNTNNCERGVNAGYCGDNKINNYYNEQCDGNEWGKISKSSNTGCQQLGFDSGTLSCNSAGSSDQCEFNTTRCIGKPDKPFNCGDLYLGHGEQCDPSVPFNTYPKNNLSCDDFDEFDGGTLSCTSGCQFDISRCNKPTICGDDTVNTAAGEECEINMVRNCSVEYPGIYTSGIVRCKTSSCTWNTADCSGPPVCGNAKIEAINNEQCDSTNLNGITCNLFAGFSGGTLRCNPSNSTSNRCMWDTTRCIPIVTTNTSLLCGNNILQSGEQCEGSAIPNPALWKVKLGCNNSVICSGCVIKCGATPPHCQNTVKDTGETDTDCGGASCIGCALNKTCANDNDCDSKKCGSDKKCAINPCRNTIKDINESDIDCGGNCITKCGTDKNCTTGIDCQSAICGDNKKCAALPCENHKQDAGESDIDCGGSCTACIAGKKCVVNDDCASNNCVESICSSEILEPDESAGGTSTGVNTTGLVLLLIGILFILGGGGYIAYKTFIEKKSIRGQSTSGMSQGYGGNISYDTGSTPLTPQAREAQKQMRVAQAEHEHQRMLQIQKKMEEKKFQKEQARSSVLDQLDDEKTKKALEEAQKKAKEKDTTTSTVTDYVDMDTLTKEVSRKDEAKKIASKTIAQSKANDAFSKLSTMSKRKTKNAGNLEKSSDGYVELTTNQDTGKTSAKTTDAAQKSAFDELKAATKELDRAQVKAQLAALSGKEGKKIDRKIDNVLGAKMISAVDADRLFTGLTREKLTSDLFKTILSSLVTSGKLSKRDVTNLLFEYMDSGTLTKKDVAKITTELKLT